MSRSKHSGGNWPIPGQVKAMVAGVSRILAEGKRNAPKSKSEKRKPLQGSSYSQSVGKPMKKIKSAESAVEKLRKNRGGRLP